MELGIHTFYIRSKESDKLVSSNSPAYLFINEKDILSWYEPFNFQITQTYLFYIKVDAAKIAKQHDKEKREGRDKCR